jgi:hypothetical protein
MPHMIEKNLASLGKLTVGFVFAGCVGEHAVLFAPAGMARWPMSRYL